MRITLSRRRLAIAAGVVAAVACFLGARQRLQTATDARIVGHWTVDNGWRTPIPRQQLPRTYGYSFFAGGAGLLRYSSGNYSRVRWSSADDLVFVELREFGPVGLISNLRLQWQAITGQQRTVKRQLRIDASGGEMRLVRAGVESMVRIPQEMTPDDRAFLERGAE
jgi:hypothetical protein